MTQYYTQTTYAPTPAEKRKDEIRARTYEHLIEREFEAEVSDVRC